MPYIAVGDVSDASPKARLAAHKAAKTAKIGVKERRVLERKKNRGLSLPVKSKSKFLSHQYPE